jgi:HK97 family phage major capsid protein
VTVPRKATGTQAYWVAEGVDLTESTITLEQIAFTAKTVGGWAEYTRKFLLQSSLDAEQLIIDDLAGILAVEIDRVAIKGGGAGKILPDVFQEQGG